MDYIEDCIIVQEEIHLLAAKINEKIKEGYQPFGSTLMASKTYYIQLMVKFKKGGISDS